MPSHECYYILEGEICSLTPLIVSRAEAGPNRGAEEVHRQAPVPHQDAGDHPEDAGQ